MDNQEIQDLFGTRHKNENNQSKKQTNKQQKQDTEKLN